MIRTLSIKPENKFCFDKLLDSRKLLSAYISGEKQVILLYYRILQVNSMAPTKKTARKENKDYCKRYRQKDPEKYRERDAERKRMSRLLLKAKNPLVYEDQKKENRIRMRVSRYDKKQRRIKVYQLQKPQFRLKNIPQKHYHLLHLLRASQQSSLGIEV